MNELEKLQNLLIFYENLLKKIKNKEIKLNNLPTWKYGKCDYFFREMVKIFGFNGKPFVLNDNVYKSLSYKTFYHGFGKYSYGNNFLKDDDYWTGTGSSSNGFYATDKFEEALSYTPENYNSKQDKNKVLEFKCDSNNSIHVHQLWLIQECILSENLDGMPEVFARKTRVLMDFVKNIENEDLRRGFLDTILFEAQLATFLGYDYIIDPDGSTSIFLNRGKMIVSENSTKTFEEGSERESVQPLK